MPVDHDIESKESDHSFTIAPRTGSEGSGGLKRLDSVYCISLKQTRDSHQHTSRWERGERRPERLDSAAATLWMRDCSTIAMPASRTAWQLLGAAARFNSTCMCMGRNIESRSSRFEGCKHCTAVNISVVTT